MKTMFLALIVSMSASAQFWTPNSGDLKISKPRIEPISCAIVNTNCARQCFDAEDTSASCQQKCAGETCSKVSQSVWDGDLSQEEIYKMIPDACRVQEIKCHQTCARIHTPIGEGNNNNGDSKGFYPGGMPMSVVSNFGGILGSSLDPCVVNCVKVCPELGSSAIFRPLEGGMGRKGKEIMDDPQKIGKEPDVDDNVIQFQPSIMEN